MRRRLDAAGYQEIKTPQLMDARQWEKSGHWGKYRENMFVVPDEIPQREDDAPILSGRRRPDGAEADELPGPRPGLQAGHHQLPRPAAPARRIRLLPPQRAARRAARHHARPPVHPGRRPHLLPRGPADRGGADVLRPARQRLPGSRFRQLRDQAGAAPRQALRHATRCGTGRSSRLRDAVKRGRPRHGRIRLGGTARRRRLLRAQARIAPDRRDRPHLAGRHDADRHRAARAARRHLYRRGRREASPGHAPPRDPRHVRAVHRHPDRASCGQVPAVAGAGPGGGRDDRLRRGRLCGASRREALGRPGIRVDTDLRNEKINYKVREHSLAKVPLLLVVGKREAEEGSVALRRLGSEDHQQMMSLDEAVAMIAAEAVPPDLR